MPSPLDQKRLDATAIILSGICLLHCLALPFALTLPPVVHVSLLDETSFHLMLMVFILPVSALALTLGCRRHRDPATLVLGAAGLAILTLAAAFGHNLFGLAGERLVTSGGGLTLACAHIRNYRCCRRHHCRHDH